MAERPGMADLVDPTLYGRGAWASLGESLVPLPRGRPQTMEEWAAAHPGDRFDPVEAIIGLAGGPRLGPRIRAYHSSPLDFEQFKPGWRGATFFAATPEQARTGAAAGRSEFYRLALPNEGPRGPNKTYEVEMPAEAIRGLHLTPKERDWFNALPERVPEAQLDAVLKDMPGTSQPWYRLYDERQIGPQSFEYIKKPTPAISYEQAMKSNRDVYGREHAHYGTQTSEAATAKRVREAGLGGYLVSDEAGLSIGVVDPSIIDILRKYGIAATATGGMGAIAAQDQYATQ